MKLGARRYWNDIAAHSAASARDAVLAGFRSEARFDDSGRIDAESLILPFVTDRDTVVDIGCGIGRLAKWVAPSCRRLVGLDISTQMLRHAKKRLEHFSNVTLKIIPIGLRFPLASSTMNFAYFYHVSEHMDREDAYKLLQEIRRCLRVNGKALIQFSLITHPDNQQEFKHWAKRGDEEGVRSRFYTEQEAVVFLRAVGLFPQFRFYIPGEFAVVVTKSDSRVLGEMPLISLSPALSHLALKRASRQLRGIASLNRA